MSVQSVHGLGAGIASADYAARYVDQTECTQTRGAVVRPEDTHQRQENRSMSLIERVAYFTEVNRLVAMCVLHVSGGASRNQGSSSSGDFNTFSCKSKFGSSLSASDITAEMGHQVSNYSTIINDSVREWYVFFDRVV